MKKTFLTTLILIFILFTIPSVNATSGGCSSHWGVNCSAGADWDGSVICNDGWRDSTTLYSQTVMCQYYNSLPQTHEEIFADFLIKSLNIALGYLNAQLNYEAESFENLSNYYIAVIQIASKESINQTEINDVTNETELLKTKIINQKSNVITLIKASKQSVTDLRNDYIDGNYYVNKIFIEIMYDEVAPVFDDLINSLKNDNTTNESIDSLYAKFIKDIEEYKKTTTTSNNEETLLETTYQTKTKSIFSDIDSSYKYSNAIAYLKNIGYIGGYADGTFKPENTINRAELLKILIGERYTISGYSNCFKDVKDEWFAPYICYAKTQGWISGYADGTFKPAQTVNRAEAIKMAIEVFGIELPQAISSSPYSDVNKDTWFAPYVQKAKESGLFDDSMTSYGASNGMKRGDVSDIIYRLLAIKKLGVNEYTKSLDAEMSSN